MKFILDVQARLEVSAQGHDERLARLEAAAQGHEERSAKLELSMATLTDLVGRVAQAETILAERMQAGFEEVKGIQAETEYKLNALIDTVDKVVRRNEHNA